MEPQPSTYQPEYETYCYSCGIDMNGGVDVVDTDTNTVHAVCAVDCITMSDKLYILPAYISPEEPDIPAHAYTIYSTHPTLVLMPVDESIEVPVVQVRTEWDSVTDVLMYEDVDMDIHTEEGDY